MRTAPALLIALVLALTGCMPDDDPIRPDPSPTSAPIFASDDEALAAAEEAYRAYVEISDVILHEAGAESDRALDLVTDGFREEAASGFLLFAERQWRSEGATTFDSATLQQYSDDGNGAVQIVLYLCLDVSETRIIGSDGSDVTPAARNPRLPLVVEMVNSADYSVDLLQAGSEVWSGNDYCV